MATWMARAVLRGLVAAAVITMAGCGGGSDDPPVAPPTPSEPSPARPTGVAVVGPQGGVVRAPDGAVVDVPREAMAAPLELSIATSSLGALPLPQGAAPIGSMYAMTPHGVSFRQLTRVSVPIDPAKVPPGAVVKIARANPGGQWTLLDTQVEGNVARAFTDKFSFFVPVIVNFVLINPIAPRATVQFSVAGQNPVAARTPVIVYPNGVVDPYRESLQVLTQASAAAPLQVTIRSLIPDGSSYAQGCGTGAVQAVVMARTARIVPDPERPGQLLVRTAWELLESVYPEDWIFNDEIEIGRITLPRGPQPVEQTIPINLAHHTYLFGRDEARILDDAWRTPVFTPLPGDPGLRLFLLVTCPTTTLSDGNPSDVLLEPKLAVRRTFDDLGFSVNPQSVTVVEGDSAELSVTAAAPREGSGPTTSVVRWQRALSGAPDVWQDVPLQGAAGWASAIPVDFENVRAVLRKPAVSALQDDQTRWRAVLCTRGTTNCVTSRVATITVTQNFVAPQVLTDLPPTTTVREGTPNMVTQFSASFSGAPRPRVTWETKAPNSPDWMPVDLTRHTVIGTTLTSSVQFTLADRGRQYRAVASNFGGMTTSTPTSLFVTTGLQAPSITTQPQDVTIGSGSAVLLAAAADGSAPLSYQWFFNDAPITGANGPILALNAVNAANAGLYRLQVSNRENTVQTRSARVTVTQAAPPAVLAPKITTDPSGLTVVAGSTASFSVVATGSAPLAYQWLRKGNRIDGATGQVLTLNKVEAADEGDYSVVVSNAAGRVVSASARLTLAGVAPPPPSAPSITTQPAAIDAFTGQTVTLAVAANGSGPLTFQWRRNGVNLGAGAGTGPVLTLPNVQSVDAGSYSVVVSNGAGSVTSSAASVSVSAPPVVPPPPTAPSIVTQPAATTVTEGNTATFAVGVNGTTPMTFQWSRNGIPISGATAAAYTIASASTAAAGNYSVTVTNAAGSVTSAAAALTVNAAPPPPTVIAPSISTQPVGLAVNPGQTATFAVAASGSGPLAYQWQRNGSNLPGAVSPVLTLSNVQSANAGNYTVLVSNSAGSVTSAVATLVVAPVPGAPVITAQPANASVFVGATATFSATVTGNPTPQCQWTRNGVAISGATNCTSYTTPALTLGDNGALYNLVAYNVAGTVFGSGAVLTVQVQPSPSITQQPQNVSVTEGQPATFTAAVANAPHVQWERNGADIAGATSATYTIASTTLADNGATFLLRACTLPGAVGVCVNSNVVTLTVTPSVPANALTATQVIANNDNSLVIRPDGSLWGWGRNVSTAGTHHESGLTPGTPSVRPVRLYPSTLTDVRQVISSYGTFFALRGDGTVWHWGRADNYSDGLGADGTGGLAGSRAGTVYNLAPVQMLERRLVSGTEQAVPLDRVCQVAYGFGATVLLRAIDDAGNTTSCDATALKTVWGVGRLGGTSATFTMVQRIGGLPVPLNSASSVRAVYGSANSSGNVVGLFMAQTGDGRWFAWGYNRSGRTGVPASLNSFFGLTGTFVEVPGNPWGTTPAQFVFGNDFNYALYADGSVRVAGFRSNNTFSLGDGVAGTGDASPPVSVVSPSCTALPCTDLMSGATSIGASGGRFASVVVRNGELYGWGGEEFYGTTGVATNTSSSFTRFPNRIGTLVGVTAVSVGFYHALAIGPGGVVYSWGSDGYGLGQAGQPSSVRSAVPTMVTVP